MSETKIRILVLDRGYVKVCRCPDPEGYTFWLPYTDARTIRIWGTTRGLGELVNGPTESTVLDDVIPSGMVSVRSIIDTFLVEESKWEALLSPVPTTS